MGLQSSIEYFDGDELAAKVFTEKYALHNSKGELLENTPKDMHRRMARELARIEAKKFDVPLTEDEIFFYFDQFRYIVPQGSIMSGLGDIYRYVSLSNCFLVEKPLDSYAGIHYSDEQITAINKRRGGCGISISNLRPAGSTTLNSSRTSTGIIPFMQRYSNTIREVGQNNRRGALIITVSVHHPEIAEFITAKTDRQKVTGANISVELSDEFLMAVENDEEYEQRWPVDSSSPSISRMVKARDIWSLIIHTAWKDGEPGLLFWGNIERETPTDYYDEYRAKGVNPCIVGWAKVYTKTGIKIINDIEIGEHIWSTDGWTIVLNKIDRGNKDVYEYCIEDGTKFYCTQDHNIMSNGIKKSIKDSDYIDKFNMIGDGYFYDTVKIISSSLYSNEQVYDITVDNDSHTFWCDGFNTANCGEVILAELDACRLLLMNTYSYVVNPFTKDSYFDYKKFYEHAKIAERLMDNIVDAEAECINRIIDKIDRDPEPAHIKQRERALWEKVLWMCVNGRRTGTGVTAIGDMLAALNIPYGSDESIDMVDSVYMTLKHGAYRSSVDMAIELGSFTGYSAEAEASCPFINRIANERVSFNDEVLSNGLELYNDMKKYGRRNSALLTTSPAGSTSLLTRSTSGIEPLWELSYFRMRKLTEDTESEVDFVDKTGDKWAKYTVYHPKVKDWMRITGETDLSKSPWVTANNINWINRVRLQAAAQRHTCNSISSTVNLPKDATEEDVAGIYNEAWKSGVKGITVYRDGCRDGVLLKNTVDNASSPAIIDEKRPRELPCEIHHTVIGGKSYFVLVGMLNGKPYEVFAGKNGCIPPKVKTGTIVRKRDGFYVAKFDGADEILSPITASTSDMEEMVTRLVSLSLRVQESNMHLIVKQIEKAGKNTDMQSFARGIARVLKKYIEDGTPEGEDCPECGGPLVRKEGCISCTCGWSKCS